MENLTPHETNKLCMYIFHFILANIILKSRKRKFGWFSSLICFVGHTHTQQQQKKREQKLICNNASWRTLLWTLGAIHFSTQLFLHKFEYMKIMLLHKHIFYATLFASVSTHTHTQHRLHVVRDKYATVERYRHTYPEILYLQISNV